MSSAAANTISNSNSSHIKLSAAKKTQYTPTKALKKLYKSLKKIFVQKSNVAVEVPVYQTCLTEEEYQNYLNELLEAEAVALEA